MALCRILLVLLLVLLSSPVMAAKKGGSKESSGIDNETLTGGVIHKEGYFLPRGLKIPVELRTPIDTRLNKVSDQITVQVTEDIMIGDYIIIPANTFLHGYISELESPGRWRKDPKVNLAFDSISLKGIEEKDSRRYISIKGSVKERQMLKKSDKVSDETSYKDKAKKMKKLGGLGGAATAYAYTQYAEPFAGLGIGGMLCNMLIMGGGVGGMMLATSLITRDDIRMEPGTKLEVILDQPSLESFPAEHLLSYNTKHDAETAKEEIKPEQAYDALSTLEAEKLDMPPLKKALAKSI